MTDEQRAKLVEMFGPTFAFIVVNNVSGDGMVLCGEGIDGKELSIMLGALLSTASKVVKGTIETSAGGDERRKAALTELTLIHASRQAGSGTENYHGFAAEKLRNDPPRG